jgi:ProP effector
MTYRNPRLVREILVARFPACFCPKGSPKRPLKIGIARDLVAAAPDIKPGEIGRALADYTRGPTYLLAMIEGAERIDLAGQAAGVVTAAQAELAAAQVAPILVDMAKRRAGPIAQQESAE